MIQKKVIALILGGGAGTRLFPLTANRSKPAVPIAGKYRLVDIPISNCINSAINRIFVLTQYNSASLNKHIKNTYQFSGFTSGFVDLLAAEQTPDSPGWFQGTADAVRQSLKHIQKEDFDYVLILSGDQLYQMDFLEMLEKHQLHQSDISIATIPVDEKSATEFGILKTDNQDNVASFIEKPDKQELKDWVSFTGDKMKAEGRVYLASMGIYLFNRSVLFKLLNHELNIAADFGKEVIPFAMRHYKISSYQYESYWTDIGSISSFFEANLALTANWPSFNLFDNVRMIYTRARMLPPAKINGTYLHQALIADGSIINADSIENAVIGVRSRIGKGSKISSAYIMGNDYYEVLSESQSFENKSLPMLGIGEYCMLSHVIVDKDCKIGNHVIIKGGPHLENSDHPQFSIRDGIVIIKKGAVINDGFELGY
jgi:glucose-1-phosphate adenylyltransferase